MLQFRYMKKTIITLLASFLVILPSSVSAATTPNATPTTSSTDTLQQRIDKRKGEQKLTLSTTEKTNLTNKCKAAQVILGKLQSRVATMQQNRTQYYTDVFGKLTSVQTKLKAQNIDTSTLGTAITKFTTLVTQFTTDLTTYKQNIDDAVAMECTKDVVGFKSILETARTGRTTLIKDSSDINDQLKAIKSALAAIKSAQTTENK
jgi:hypothetical protein